MDYLQNLYSQFLGFFPNFLHPFISIAVVVFLVYSIVQALKKNFIFLIVLVVLLPASIPILKNVVDILIGFIKYLLGAN
ncbi:MAG TPA: hypothetical protein VHQ41_00020 [Patescibacteria group bacterium]|jgi:hypothetical protein|nr:hypothetical protein [Patescibacteria group bacterium]